jgi:hypothetical protein
MFTKKPLTGLSCASCEKNITNLYGQGAVDHTTWNRMPVRDPADRIARVGQGFSKMLSMMKPDISSVISMRATAGPSTKRTNYITPSRSP